MILGRRCLGNVSGCSTYDMTLSSARGVLATAECGHITILRLWFSSQHLAAVAAAVMADLRCQFRWLKALSCWKIVNKRAHFSSRKSYCSAAFVMKANTQTNFVSYFS